jgi:hypothetical protein
VRLRRAGATVPQISDMVGMSEQMVKRYCRFADQKQNAIAAVHILDRTVMERVRAKSKKSGNPGRNPLKSFRPIFWAGMTDDCAQGRRVLLRLRRHHVSTLHKSGKEIETPLHPLDIQRVNSAAGRLQPVIRNDCSGRDRGCRKFRAWDLYRLAFCIGFRSIRRGIRNPFQLNQAP